LHQRIAELACFEANGQAANATLCCNMPPSFGGASCFRSWPSRKTQLFGISAADVKA
jgi:hypothetical protein